MSYRRPNTGNPILDYVIAIDDFNMLSNHLLSAKTEESFEIWFEKLELINKDALYMYLTKNKHRIPEEFIRMVQRRFPKKI